MIKNLTTLNLILSSPSLDDLSALNSFENRNKNHLKKWESTPFPNLENKPIAETSNKNRLENWIRECEEGASVRFFIRPKSNSDLIIGFCNFTQIFHGSFQACYLGYKIDCEYEGKGFMFEALESSIEYLFKTCGIHRIMANYIPNNIRSAKLLNRLNFAVEGYAKNYLLINNQWEDHVLTALSSEQWDQRESNQSKKLLKMQKLESPSNCKDLTFREVELNDVCQLISLMEQLGYPISESLLMENIQKYILLPNQKAWIAEYSGKISGCIAVAITSYFHRPGSFLRVIAMIVDQDQRRLGVGKGLMSLAEKYAFAHGCSHIELTSGAHRVDSGAHEFYKSLGYTELNNTKKLFGKRLQTL